MAIISKFIQEASPIFRFKAPQHTMYKIYDIHFTTLVAGNNAISVLDYLVEDERTVINPTLSSEGVLSVFDTGIAGNHQDYDFGIPEVSKFISIARLSAVTFNAFVVINYELIKASRTELLIEWFRKGR